MLDKNYAGTTASIIRSTFPNITAPKQTDLVSMLDQVGKDYQTGLQVRADNKLTDEMIAQNPEDEARIRQMGGRAYADMLKSDAQRAEERQWHLDDLEAQRQFQRDLLRDKLNNEFALAKYKASNSLSDGFNNTDAGMALRILQSPDKYTPQAQAWAELQSKKLSPEFVYDNSYNQAIGRGAGERASSWAGQEEMGYYKEDGKTYIAPGSDAEMDYLKANRKILTNNEVSARAAQTVLDDIAAMKRIAKEHPNQVASWGSKISFIPGSPAYDFAARIDSIRGNAAVDQLLNIKQSGAGLGQVPQQQLNMLADMTGNLSRAQSLPELMDVINRFERIYTNVRDKAAAENNRINGRIKPQKQQSGLKQFAQPTDEDAWGI